MLPDLHFYKFCDAVFHLVFTKIHLLGEGVHIKMNIFEKITYRCVLGEIACREVFLSRKCIPKHAEEKFVLNTEQLS